MAKYSGLTLAASFLDSHEWGVNEGGVSKKINGALLRAALPQGTPSGGYAQILVDSGTFTAVTDITGLAATVTLAAGRRIRVSCQCQIASSVAGDRGAVFIREGATTLTAVSYELADAGSNYGNMLGVILTPGSGAHTYKVSASRDAGSGNITAKASGTNPAWILVEDIGV
jgi:hypothetical protein